MVKTRNSSKQISPNSEDGSTASNDSKSDYLYPYLSPGSQPSEACKFEQSRKPKASSKFKQNNELLSKTIKTLKEDMETSSDMLSFLSSSKPSNCKDLSYAKFSCSMCGSVYEQDSRLPVCLPCGHSLCKECSISNKTSPLKGKCPFDGKEYYYIIDKMPVNFAVLEGLREGKGILCQEHQLTIVGFCKDHHELLCGKCIFLHKDHQIIDIESSEAEEVASQVYTKLSENRNLTQTELTKWNQNFQKVLKQVHTIRTAVFDHVYKFREAEKSLIEKLRTATNKAVDKIMEYLKLMPPELYSTFESVSEALNQNKGNYLKILHEMRDMSSTQQLNIQVPELRLPRIKSLSYLKELIRGLQSIIDYEQVILDCANF